MVEMQVMQELLLVHVMIGSSLPLDAFSER
jgi:hypothetical protein